MSIPWTPVGVAWQSVPSLEPWEGNICEVYQHDAGEAMLVAGTQEVRLYHNYLTYYLS